MSSAVEERDVVVVGGGVGGLEALMALSDLGDNRLRLHLVSNAVTFSLPPELLGVPWGKGVVHLDLERVGRAFGARFELGVATGVDTDARELLLAGGEVVPYDELLLAPGARRLLPFGADVRTLGFSVLPRTLADDLTGSVAIVVPEGVSWTLPAYQLALHCVAEGRCVEVTTAEPCALDAFGRGVRDAVDGFLARHGVRVRCASTPAPAEVLGLADTVVALPLLAGPGLTGLENDEAGFARVDATGAAVGVRAVHVVGDATGRAMKQGGLAAQQADVAAAEIVRACGGDPPAVAYEPVLRGKLVAEDGEELHLRRALDGVDQGAIQEDPLWQPASAICAWRLARWLDYHRGDLQPFVLDRPPVDTAATR